jgi:hypothetical protein
MIMPKPKGEFPVSVALGTVAGAVTKHASKTGPIGVRIGSAVGATLATGGTVGAAMSAGAAPVAAAVAAGTAGVVAAAPFVIGAALIGGAIWGVSKLLED